MRVDLRARWFLALGWLFLIYASLPFVRPLATFLRERNLLRLTFALVFFIFALPAFRRMYERRRYMDLSLVLYSIVMVLAYSIAILNIPLPEERFHFIQYGVLVYLVFQALRAQINAPSAYALAFLLTSLAGWGDEGIQHILPDRYYELKDVWLNCLGALLGLGVTFIGEKLNTLTRPK